MFPIFVLEGLILVSVLVFSLLNLWIAVQIARAFKLSALQKPVWMLVPGFLVVTAFSFVLFLSRLDLVSSEEAEILNEVFLVLFLIIFSVALFSSKATYTKMEWLYENWLSKVKAEPQSKR